MTWLGDGVKKGAAVACTAVLPRTLRVAARERWLARLEVGRARRAGLILVAHPKSGNTWLKVMLSRLYTARHGLPASMIAGSDELARRDPAIPRIAATNGWYSYEGAVGRLLAPETRDPELARKPVVFLARHPIDIAVSWYHQFTKRQSDRKQELINHSIPHPIDRRTISMWDFVRYSDIGLPFLIEYLNEWERRVVGLERARIVRYEDLRAEPELQLRHVTELMGESFSADEIAEAVRFASFDNLQSLESKGFFPQAAMRTGRGGEPQSRKVRRGKVGGYREDFGPEQVAELEELVAKGLSPSLGYGAEGDAGAADRAS